METTLTGYLLRDFHCVVFGAAVHNDDFEKAWWVILAIMDLRHSSIVSWLL